MTNEQCAIKIVNKERVARHQTLVDLMEQELNVLQNTDHPNIVRVIELIQDDVNFYTVTELMTGGELYQLIVKLKRMSER